jgi:hypothetical protein
MHCQELTRIHIKQSWMISHGNTSNIAPRLIRSSDNATGYIKGRVDSRDGQITSLEHVEKASDGLVYGKAVSS